MVEAMNEAYLTVKAADAGSSRVQFTDMTIRELELQGFTHLIWTCTKCDASSSRGLRLIRIRRQFRPDDTITKVAAELACGKRRHRPDPKAIKPEKQDGRSQAENEP